MSYIISYVGAGGKTSSIYQDAAAFVNEGKKVMIPMPGGFESLNAAQAATIFLFEYVRRLTGAGGNKL